MSEKLQRGSPSIHFLNISEHWSGLYSAVCPPPAKSHNQTLFLFTMFTAKSLEKKERKKEMGFTK